MQSCYLLLAMYRWSDYYCDNFYRIVLFGTQPICCAIEKSGGPVIHVVTIFSLLGKVGCLRRGGLNIYYTVHYGYYKEDWFHCTYLDSGEDEQALT